MKKDKKCGECHDYKYTGDKNEGWCSEIQRRVKKDEECTKDNKS